MKIVYLLLHDFRFESIGLREFAFRRFHFSKEYARRLATLGHEVKLYVMSNEISRTQVVQMDGYELKAFRSSLHFPPWMKFGNDHSIEVMKELDRDSPDLVHLHNYYLWNFPYIAPWTRRKGTPLVAQYHGTDPIRRVKAFCYFPALELCNRLLVPLQSEENLLTRSLRIPSERVQRFPSTGVDTNVFHPTGHKMIGLTLFYSGRVPMPTSYQWEKAPHYLIPIIRALLDLRIKAKLVMAGDGPGLPNLKSLARRFEVQDSIDFLGLVDHRELPKLYSSSTFTFVPLFMEEIGPYWGGSVQESLACGTPVIGFNDESPGFSKVGLLVPANPTAAAHLIREASNDSGWLSSVEEEGPKLVRTNCDWRVIVSRMNRLYSKLQGQ